MDSTKLNLDDLYERKKQCDLNMVNSYNRIIERIHKQIKLTSRQKMNNECCWYVVPEFIFGIPKYDLKECIAYIIHELKENGFHIKYTHPNLLFITWSHWIPDYVRVEYKKQTGITIDGYGKEIKKEEPKKSIFKSTSSYKPTGSIYDEIKLK